MRDALTPIRRLFPESRRRYDPSTARRLTTDQGRTWDGAVNMTFVAGAFRMPEPRVDIGATSLSEVYDTVYGLQHTVAGTSNGVEIRHYTPQFGTVHVQRWIDPFRSPTLVLEGPYDNARRQGF